jgi:hypothetical protein
MSTILLIIAYFIDTIFTVPLTLLKSIQNRKRLSEYHYNIALHYDYKWCSHLFQGYDGHSVSAVCWKRYRIDNNKKYLKYVRIINKVFRDNFHCENAYIYEFITKPNLTLKAH